MIKMEFLLTYSVERITIDDKKVYSIALGSLIICFSDDITLQIAEEIIKLYKELKPKTWKVVFKDNGFESDSDKTNIREILKCVGLSEDAFITI